MAVKAQNGYPMLDRFRVLAAVFVVANHTAALFSLSPVLNNLITYGIGRVAVPFFFMASGFFLLPEASLTLQEQVKRLLEFTLRTAKLYGIAVLLYLPLNLYMQGAGTVLSPGFLKLLLWEGTFYHLWYFPAAVLGAWVGWLLWRMPCRKGAFAVAGFLYLFALLGDNYALLVENNPVLGTLSRLGVLLFGFTRNGLLFAPLFFLLGLTVRSRPAGSHSKGFWGVLTLAGFTGLGLENLLIFWLSGIQPAESLYLLLPLCVPVLFCWLLCYRDVGKPHLRTISMLVYLLHPLCIVVLHQIFKLLGQPDIMLQNSLVFFLATLAATLALSAGCMAVQQLWRAATAKENRVTATLDKQALLHNLGAMRGILPAGCETMAVVKANAYGHGAVAVAQTLQKQGVKRFAVATLEEGIQLRRHGVRGEILILGYTSAKSAPALWLYQLTQTAVDMHHAKALAASRLPVRVHIKLDTGMHRLGIPADNIDEIASVYTMGRLRVNGIYGHLLAAEGRDAESLAITQRQAKAYFAAVEALRRRGIQPGTTHLLSSYGVLNHPSLICDCARIGLALYGGTGDLEGRTLLQPQLRPAMKLQATIASVRHIPAGEGVGYSHAWHAERDTLLATVCIGYGDGFPRSLSCTGGRVLLHGKSVPVVGRISMDSLAIDVTDCPETAPGDTVTLMGCEGGTAISPAELAGLAGTIPNEILCRISERVKRR